MTGPEDLDRERRRIIRKIGLISWGLAAGALLLAVGGGALLAWLLTGAGLPFVRTWIIASVLLLVIPAAAQLVAQGHRGDRGTQGHRGTEEPGDTEG